jgi:hypothetical protein
VDEVDVEPVDLGGELGQGVELLQRKKWLRSRPKIYWPHHPNPPSSRAMRGSCVATPKAAFYFNFVEPVYRIFRKRA